MDGQNWSRFQNRLHLHGKLENRRPTIFQIDVSLHQNVIYKARKLFPVVTWLRFNLQLKDSCSASLAFRAHN